MAGSRADVIISANAEQFAAALEILSRHAAACAAELRALGSGGCDCGIAGTDCVIHYPEVGRPDPAS
jgi:hypothetical protein